MLGTEGQTDKDHSYNTPSASGGGSGDMERTQNIRVNHMTL